MGEPGITWFETYKDVLIPFGSAIIGGLIAGLFALWALIKNHRHDLKMERRAERAKLRSYYRSLQAELEALRGRYEEIGLADINSLPDGQGVEAEFLATQDYFVVYRGNSSAIGSVPNDKLRGMIIDTYIGLMGLVDTLNINSDLYKEWFRLTELTLSGEPGGDTRQAQVALAKHAHDRWAKYAEAVRRDHRKSTADAKALIAALKVVVKNPDAKDAELFKSPPAES